MCLLIPGAGWRHRCTVDYDGGEMHDNHLLAILFRACLAHRYQVELARKSALPYSRAHTALGLAMVLLCGCADVSMPDYRRPETPVKASWSGPNAPAAAVSASDTIAPDWWKEFHDPYLDSLVSKAIEGNFDVRVLAARIRVANAEIGEVRAEALPTLDAGAGASFEKTTGQNFSKQFNLATQVNWDIDVWGKVEKGVQAQKAEFRASEADWRAGFLTLVSDVSTTYFQILQLD
jgi:outer membrane protein TolC